MRDEIIFKAGEAGTYVNQNLHTSCKECKFAIYDGITQMDCKLGRLDNWDKHGVLVPVQDHEKQYYVIERDCNGWNPHEECSIEEAREIMKLKYSLILIESDLDKINELIDEINQFEVKPKEVYFVIKEDGHKMFLKLHKADGYTVYLKEYFIQSFYDDAIFQIASKIDHVKSPYVICAKDNVREFVNKIEQIYNYDLTQFLVVKQNENVCWRIREFKLLGMSETNIRNEKLIINL